jgi:hypothetical protein
MFSHRAIAVLTGIIFLIHVSGCAAIFKGANEDVTVESSPSGAEVKVNGQPKGTTPVTLSLESKETYDFTISKKGYEDRHISIGHNLGAGWVVLDVLLGLIPVVVDAVTGAWYKLDQNSISIDLEKVSRWLKGVFDSQQDRALASAGGPAAPNGNVCR